jgi:WD40 repeat protein
LPGEQRLVSSSDDRSIRLWDLKTMQEVIDLRGHRDTVFSAVSTADGETIFSGSGDYTLRRWGTRSVGQLAATRQEYDRIAGRLEAIVDEHLRAAEDSVSVAERVDADRTLSERERQIARQLLIGRTVHRPE